MDRGYIDEDEDGGGAYGDYDYDEEEEEEDGSAAAPLMEIREFLDSNGAPTRADVVNISQASDTIASSTSAEQNAAIDAVIEKLQSRIIGADGSRGAAASSAAAGAAGQGATQPLDEHSAFVKELAELSAQSSRRHRAAKRRSPGGNSSESGRDATGTGRGRGSTAIVSDGGADLSFLDALEREEAAAQAAEKGRFLGNAKGGGWKKGFLGGGDSKPKAKASATAVTTTAATTSIATAVATAPPLPAPALAAAAVPVAPAPAIVKSEASTMQTKSVRFDDTTSGAAGAPAASGLTSTSGSSSGVGLGGDVKEKAKPRPAAFSGTIMERF